MEHPLLVPLEHPLIVALRHAGLTTQQVAREVQRGHVVPETESEFTALVDALLADPCSAAGQDGPHEATAPAVRHRMKRRAASDQHVNRTEIMDTLVSMPVVDRRRIIGALAAGTGSELSTQFGNDRLRLVAGIEVELAHWAADQSNGMLWLESPL